MLNDLFFCVWLTSLYMTVSRSVNVAVSGIIPFFFYGWSYSIVYMDCIFFMHSVDGRLGCFHVLAIVNSATVNIGMHISFGIIIFSGYMKKTERWRIDASKLWCWRRLLRVSWTARRSNQSILKSILTIRCKDWCWSWNSNTLATWCEEPTHWKRPWCWGS